MMGILQDQGCQVVGTSEEFNGWKGGIWLSSEGSKLLEYYGFYDTLGVEPNLDAMVNDWGWHFEWYDAGTMMCWPNN